MSYQKFNKIIPVGEKRFAYQGENVDTMCVIRGHIPFGGGKEPYLNEEKDRINEYELRIVKTTSNSLSVQLWKFRNDTVKQRKNKGKAIIAEMYEFGSDFAFLVNQIFKDVEVGQYNKEEHFPKAIEELMTKVYDK